MSSYPQAPITRGRTGIRRRDILKLGAAGVLGGPLLLAPVGAARAASGDKLTIGAIIYARDSQFWQQIERGMRDAAKANGAELLVGMNRRQLPVESQLVDDYMTRNVDALIVPPLDKQGTEAAAKLAKAKGIMVVEYDTQLADKSIASHSIGVDSFALASAVGKEMHDYIEKQLKGAASIGLISLPPMNANSGPRRDGMLKALSDVKLKVVAEVSGSTPEQGANGLENILQRDPHTQIVWASNAGTVAGAAVAATRSKAEARLYGIDMSQELASMLLDPKSNLAAVADQQPYRVGYLAVETAVKAKRGSNEKRYVMVPPKLYTREDPASVKQYLDLVKSLS
ncbi:substrate-binding domain-containing protein [Caballeronia sp. GAFFF2]|uniref:substrate-binding domain-containing protein n=1 Tax=Caballeronia sp. GAFFF2 TaxID=2921741 RepID=UPI00202881BD|nr:substrate-binding domain-containing protein [Caballeronia sp. GAFFF2]